MTNILYTVATDKNGQLIKANDAEKGNDFFSALFVNLNSFYEKAVRQEKEQNDHILLIVH